MSKPRLIIFDVNETLLDLAPLQASVGRVLGGREDLLPLWFTTMLHYSLVETLTGEHHNFGEIGAAALMMVAEQQSIELTYDDALASVIEPLESLPPHADVAPGLEALSKQGFQIVSLTNTYSVGVTQQFTKAGILQHFDKRYSVETPKKYKPHPDAYAQVVADTGLDPGDILMVASHAWDLMGAKQAGFQTAFLARPGMSLYPNTARPDYVTADLLELAKVLDLQQ